MDKETAARAEIEVIFSTALYLLPYIGRLKNGESFEAAVLALDKKLRSNEKLLSEREKLGLIRVKRAIEKSSYLKSTLIADHQFSRGKLNVCAFLRPDGEMSVVFRGTASLEWIDNGEGLSGIPRKNRYYIYDPFAKVSTETWKDNDHATPSQVEALNWFMKTAQKYSLDAKAPITVSGHSKGGNKAQFICMNTDLCRYCFAFDAQGFSPEAVLQFKNVGDETFQRRSARIESINAYNDYVNVLGERVSREENTCFLICPMGDGDPVAYHYAEALTDFEGRLYPECPQGEISEYIENVSRSIMGIAPKKRRYVTLSVMNLCQKYMGKTDEAPVGAKVGALKGLGIAAPFIIHHLFGTKDGKEAILELTYLYGTDRIEKVLKKFDLLGKKYGEEAKTASILGAASALAFAVPLAGREKWAKSALSGERAAMAALAKELMKTDTDAYRENISLFSL
ncbi:MAG: DUF2974 domain-containing protein [Ruminococcaceae bacterium]|nr:DUF2974 domain-containing protein [Oscillospiraceae bacterium]